MNYYENIAIAEPSLGEEEVAEVMEKISSLITKHGGEIIKADNWGKRDLAYELNDRKKGYYLFFQFRAPSALIKKLEDYYKVYDPVFKFMVIRMGKKEVAALLKSMQSENREEPASEGAEVV